MFRYIPGETGQSPSHFARAITGERKVEKEEKGKKYHRIERAYGNFLRSFALPDAADGSKVTAEFKDGVFEDREGKAEIGRGQGRMMPIGKKRAGQRSGGMWRVPPARGRLWPQS